MLKSLVDYYEYLLEHNVEGIARPGWSAVKVTALANIDEDGSLLGIIPSEEMRGWVKQVPKRVERSSGVAANILCDTSTYIFGVDNKGKPDRAKKCFAAAKEANIDFLKNVDSDAARAVMAFFENWNPENADNNKSFKKHKKLLFKGGNIAFYFNGEEVLADEAIKSAVMQSEADRKDSDAEEMVCLVTGKKAPVARLHPKIKGVLGAQSSGAALVSFNAPALDSYGRDGAQGLNAPVSEYAAFAYTTALNYLLSDELHHIRIGETTIVYWSLKYDCQASTLFRKSIDPEFSLRASSDDEDPSKDLTGENDLIKKARRIDSELDAIMASVSQDKEVEGVSLDVPFFIIGLDPNAARISVRFFLQDTLGAFLRNLNKHYKRAAIAHASQQSSYLSPFRLVWETQNPHTKREAATSLLTGAFMRSVLSDSPYPVALYEHAIVRVRSTHDDYDKHLRKVDYGRAALIKACLIKNYEKTEEMLAVNLNEDNESLPYLLGRLFSVLEQAQLAEAKFHDKKLDAATTRRYFNSACSRPSVAFPELLKRNRLHLKNLKNAGKDAWYTESIGELISKIDEQAHTYPSRLTIEEQGEFIIGYWSQRQSKFDSTQKQENESQED